MRAMAESSYRRLKLACYTTNVSTSVMGNLSPMLFMTFRSLYGISYSLLGLLVFLNFTTQLAVDLVFCFFSHRFDIAKATKLTPALSTVGLLVYALWPLAFPEHAYRGLVVGTLIFSAAGGLAEVLISPVIAAIPSEDPDREMSKLHSIYAWGVVFVIVAGTLFLRAFGPRSWQGLALLFTLIPFAACLLFAGAQLPPMKTPERASGALRLLRSRELLLCVWAIFLGGASECTMAQWSSGYLERALGIPKVWGDIFGVALFGAMLGLGRSLYAKVGRRVERVLLAGAAGAAVCYLVTALTPAPALGLAACALTGFCVSMLWPGSLIVSSGHFPEGGVVVFALMAAGGDMGGSLGPQIVGLITDAVIAMPSAAACAARMGISAEQLGMKAGLLVGMLFPLAAIPVYARLCRAARARGE